MSTLTATVFGARPQTAAEDRLTEAGAAERFARLHGDDLRYDFRRARWLTYFGHRWTPDADGAMTRRALEFARTWQREAVDIPDRDKREATFKAAIRLERRDALQSMLALARDLKPIADAGDQWDSDPMLLGVVNGVVDLRTGILRDGCRADRITMQTAYPFDPDAQRPRFERFVLEVSDGDTSLANYHQYIAGMALTGDVSEQILPMWIGRGSNGKSTLLHVLLEVWGDYGEVAAFSTFERAAVRGSIPNDLAALAGKRLVVASETREGARLDEGRLKSITGGDRLKARFLNREWFSFEPTFTLILCMNHRPVITDDSFGFWRRVRLVPFECTFAKHPTLADELTAEAPGVLRWAVEGCVAWHRTGSLTNPERVERTTADYAADSDILGEFLAEACTLDRNVEVRASEFYQHYRFWAERQGLTERERLSATKFGRKVSERFKKQHGRNGKVYSGVETRSL